MGLMRGAGMKVFLTVLACLLVLGMILQMI
jgi:hypothetical protein